MLALPPFVLTRPEGRNAALAACLRRQGRQVLELPALQIHPLAAKTSTLPLPGDYDLVVFVSGIAARLYARQLQDVAGLSRWPSAVPAACVGPATAAAMQGGFWPPSMRIVHPGPDAPTHDSEALWQELQQSGLTLRKVLVVRGNVGREWLSDQLVQAGCHVERHAVYLRERAIWSAAALDTLAAWRDAAISPVWLVTSAQGLQALHLGVVEAGMQAWWQEHRFVVTHPKLVDSLASVMGWADKDAQAMVKICLPDDDAIAQALLA